jgi:hypothetical protein
MTVTRSSNLIEPMPQGFNSFAGADDDVIEHHDCQ